MKYKAVIFDLDGTLLNTIQDLADSMNAALASLGYPGHDVDTYRSLVGNGIESLVQQSLPQNAKDHDIVHKCVLLFRDRYSESWANYTKPYEGIQELLDKLKSMQIKMAVLSNKAHVFTGQTVSHFFGMDIFKEVRGEIAGIPRKPDPSSALDIAEKLSIDPAQIVFVGDGSTDMQTAVRAGMYPVGVLWGYRSAEELKEAGAKKLISSPDELSGLLK